MSSLEERREARRRRRQQEEELDVKSSLTSPGLDDPLNEKKQKEREDRLQRIAAGFSTINGEDELERRRKERREQRLRSGETETPAEDTSSRRSRRRRGTEDDIDTSATEETDSAPVSVPEPESQPQVNNNAEEEESRRREEEEEAERQRQAAEETRRRQQEEEDRRRREDEERRQREEEEQRKREEEERLERERQEAEEREREEAARQMEEQQKKKKGKRKGLGGLSPEKKKMLKKLIMQKAAEDLRNEAKAKAEEKERYINERVGPLSLEGKAEGDLVKLCKQLHQQLSKLEEEVYDWEVKIRKQDQEIITLTLKVNDSKGKFAKPVLKKVNKTESKFKKLTSKTSKDKADFRDNLKSTGQSKFAIDEEEKK
ncbi:Hypothetical predicted protein [Mytilus galloprovincialis]|uniref:Troponin I n=1 Tax=Mytilus galloprovincialis TaxID=29158 RepID=A0A8B6HSR6_MYTGA|nr:Hypothetical predicted protein [Mytilus galloprovincialis]